MRWRLTWLPLLMIEIVEMSKPGFVWVAYGGNLQQGQKYWSRYIVFSCLITSLNKRLERNFNSFPTKTYCLYIAFVFFFNTGERYYVLWYFKIRVFFVPIWSMDNSKYFQILFTVVHFDSRTNQMWLITILAQL